MRSCRPCSATLRCATASASEEMSAASTSALGKWCASRMARQPEPVHRSSALSHGAGVRNPRREPVGQQLGDERARNDHALVDIEAEFAEPRLVREVGRGDALVDAALDHLQHLARARRASGARRETARGGRAAGAACAGSDTPLRRRRSLSAVAEEQASRVEARHRVAQPVADGLQFLQDGAHRFVRRELRRAAIDTDCAALAQQPFQYATIERGQRLEIGDGDALVELVDRGVDGTQLDDLAADVGDEASVRRAAGAGKLGRDAADLADRVADDVDQPAARRQVTACPSRSIRIS